MSRLSPLHAPARTLGVALSAVTKWLAATSLALVAGDSLAAQATLISDQADYQPGTTATLTGAGFEAGESVRLQVLHDDGTPGTGVDHDPWFVDADASGGFVTNWHVCEDDCVGSALIATADGQASARHAEAYFTDAVGTGWVSVSSSTHCVDSTAPQGRGPGNWEVRQGGTYVMTVSGVTECTGDTITVFVQNSSSGNFCFNATRMAPGVYAGGFTMPNPACNTFPISYKCGANAPCNNDSTWAARYFSDGRDNTVHLRASNFDANCNATSTDTNCAPDCVPCTLICPPDITVDCGSSTAPASTGMPGGCTNASYTDSVTAGACAGSYVITRTWTASDGCGNSSSCTQTITVRDTHGPAIVCPGDVSLDCSEPTDPGRTGSATATDDCSGVADLRYSDSTTAGSCAGNYVIARTWTATDGCGNSSSCTQTITVSDTHGPAIVCPGDVGLDCSEPTDPGRTGSATATDDCSGVADLRYSDSTTAGSCAGSYVIARTWTATDGCGNSSSCTQTITVSDTHGPAIVCPGDVSLDCSEPTDPGRTGSATATDDCSGVADLRYSDSTTAGSCAGNYVIARTWTATDGCGNSTSCTQTITVSDTHAPSILCPPDITVSAGGACCVSVDLGTPAVDDDCSGTLVTNDAPAQFCVGDTTVTWTATDGCGNASTCTQTVRVLGQICASKFYDANANGVRDPEEVGVEGWKMIVTGTASFVGYTDASGSVCFDAPAGTYEVAEGLALETNWVGTTAPSCTVVIDSGRCTATCEFGNYCFKAPSNGFTLGFWSNKNGQAILSLNDASSPNWREVVNGLNLRNANGTFFTVPTTGGFNAAYSGFRTWLLNATATNMAYMLSAQLAATTLDTKYRGLSNAQAIVVPGGAKTIAGVCIVPFLSVSQAISCGTPPLLSLTAIPGSTACGCSSNDGLVTIGDLRARAICLLGAYGTTVSASTQRTYQECVKCLLDMINNNGAPAGYPCGGLSQYLNSTDDSCPATF